MTIIITFWVIFNTSSNINYVADADVDVARSCDAAPLYMCAANSFSLFMILIIKNNLVPLSATPLCTHNWTNKLCQPPWESSPVPWWWSSVPLTLVHKVARFLNNLGLVSMIQRKLIPKKEWGTWTPSNFIHLLSLKGSKSGARSMLHRCTNNATIMRISNFANCIITAAR